MNRMKSNNLNLCTKVQGPSGWLRYKLKELNAY